MANDTPEAFATSIAEFVQRAGGNARFFIVAFLNRLNADIIIGTPGPGNSIAASPPRRGPTGFLRGSWFASLNGVSEGKGVEDTAGSISVSRVSFVASAIKPGDTFYLVNNAAYAARQEFGFVGADSLGRNYNQPGRFWVRSATERASQHAEAAFGDINGSNQFTPTGGISGGAFTSGPVTIGG